MQSSSVPSSIHEHTPAVSHSAPVAKPLQNEEVWAEYPVQHPSPCTGAGVAGAGVVVVCLHSSGSSVSTQSQFAAESHALCESPKLKQKALNGSSP
jgi:hypothetical protein